MFRCESISKVKKSKIKKQEESLIMYEILCVVYEMKSCAANTITITMTKTGSVAVGYRLKVNGERKDNFVVR